MISPEFSEQKTTITPIDRKRIVKTLVYLERRNQPTYSGRITIRAFGSHRQMTENNFLHFERLLLDLVAYGYLVSHHQ